MNDTIFGLCIAAAVIAATTGLFLVLYQYNKGQRELARECIGAGGSWVASNCVAPRTPERRG